MALITSLQAWLASRLHRDEGGQGTTEYVLLILSVVLFLIVAAFALQGVLNGPISRISTWIGSQSAP